MKDYNGFDGATRQREVNWMNRQYDAGLRERPTTCCACGQTKGRIHAHSEDYTEPFGEHSGKFPLCFRCHMMLHCRHRSPEAWAEYRDAVASGITFVPAFTFKDIEVQLGGGSVNVERAGRHRAYRPLDEIENGDHDPRRGARRGQQNCGDLTP